MPNLQNLTPFGARDLLSLDRHGQRLLVVCVEAKFAIPPPREEWSSAPTLIVQPALPPVEDEYVGEPGSSSLSREGQSAYFRPGTDIYLTGHARAPGSRPVARMLVQLRVGPCVKRVLVTGDRCWVGRGPGVTLSEPVPFEQMPLVYERAFGGASPASNGPALWEPRNPVGVGLYANSRVADGRPAPNIEDPEDPVQTLSSRPQPAGFGPIARSWSPRRELAGTYDQRWIDTRAPLWPLDFDERFFCAAAPGLHSAQPLTGGEMVSIAGVSREGDYNFRLPRKRLSVRVLSGERSIRKSMLLDAVHFDVDRKTFTLTWRVSFALSHQALAQHRVSLVRELDDWERAP